MAMAFTFCTNAAGVPLLGIQSLDARASAWPQSWMPPMALRSTRFPFNGPGQRKRRCCSPGSNGYRPDIYAQAGTLLFAKDVLTWELTGKRVTEISDMTGAGLVRLPEGRYDAELLALYGLEDALPLLPPAIEPSAIAGRVTEQAAAVTGLAAGTPVIGGYFDVVSSALGSGAVRQGEASIVVGSWSINQVFSAKAVVDERVFMVSKFAHERFVNMENSATSAANLEWYVRELIERGSHHDDPFGVVNVAVGDVKPALDDPFFHPFLYGGRMGSRSARGILWTRRLAWREASAACPV